MVHKKNAYFGYLQNESHSMNMSYSSGWKSTDISTVGSLTNSLGDT